jgi:hypothetical protein
LVSASAGVARTPAKNKPIVVRLPIRKKVVILMFRGVIGVGALRWINHKVGRKLVGGVVKPFARSRKILQN